MFKITQTAMDQFGGVNNEKFNLSNFRNLLLEMHTMDVEDQERLAEQTFNNWQGDLPQLDDVLLIGCKL